MNQEIPKPVRDALARQAVGDAHPSLDVLTAFVERALRPVESEVVTHHLARCPDCREIVFLASAAAEQEVVEERELVAAAAARRGMAARPVYVAASAPAAARADIAPPKRSMRLRWLVPAGAIALLVAGVVLVQLPRSNSRQEVASLSSASNRPAVASTEDQQNATLARSPQPPPKAAVQESLAKAAPQGSIAARAGKASAQTTVAGNANDQFPAAPPAEPAPQAASSRATADTMAGMSSALVPAVRPQSSFAESESGQTGEMQKSAPALFGKPQMAMRAASVTKPRWRVSPEGHLERSVAADQWTRVLEDQPIIFHAVAVVGNDVWAGGNGGALFRSPDRGEHWSRVVLAANSSAETGAIVSIRFDDPQHGVISTSGGTSWGTIDGGVTWTTR